MTKTKKEDWPDKDKWLIKYNEEINQWYVMAPAFLDSFGFPFRAAVFQSSTSGPAFDYFKNLANQ